MTRAIRLAYLAKLRVFCWGQIRRVELEAAVRLEVSDLKMDQFLLAKIYNTMMNGNRAMTNLSTNRAATCLLSSLVAVSLVLASCGSGNDENPEVEDTTETDGTTETSAEAGTEGGTASSETETTNSGTNSSETETNSGDLADDEVTVKGVILKIPEGWTSVSKGEDLEAKLAEANPEVLARINDNGQLEALESAVASVDWVGVPPEGGVVNLVFAPEAEIDTPMQTLSDGVKSGVLAKGFDVTGEEDYTSPIGSGLRITFDVPVDIEGVGAGESRIIKSIDKLVLLSADGPTADVVGGNLDLMLDSARQA